MGLKRYMSEFSLMKEKEVPELVLWEKYLVYATVFGISEKVLKQLKVVYPQISDEQYMANGYTYLYLINSGNFRTSFISTLNTSVGTSYSSLTNYSSGSGHGGGFSSGGGFGRRRRPEWVEDKKADFVCFFVTVQTSYCLRYT